MYGQKQHTEPHFQKKFLAPRGRSGRGGLGLCPAHMPICFRLPLSSPAFVSFDASTALTIAGLVATARALFSFDAPAVSSAGRNGPQTGGIAVSVLGLNFAFNDYTQSVRLGGAGCELTSWASGTSLLCVLGEISSPCHN